MWQQKKIDLKEADIRILVTRRRNGVGGWRYGKKISEGFSCEIELVLLILMFCSTLRKL
jgi:hypothetical protein